VEFERLNKEKKKRRGNEWKLLSGFDGRWRVNWEKR